MKKKNLLGHSLALYEAAIPGAVSGVPPTRVKLLVARRCAAGAWDISVVGQGIQVCRALRVRDRGQQGGGRELDPS